MRTRPADGRRATSTAQGAWSTTSADTEPRNASSIAPCPRAPTMIRSAPISRAVSTMTEAARPSISRVVTSSPCCSQASGGLLEQGLAVGPQAVSQVVRGDIGDAGSPRAAVPIGLRREDRQDHSSAPEGQARLAAVSSPNADSVDPSIASNAFIRDSFGAIVARVPRSRTCQSDGPRRTVGPLRRPRARDAVARCARDRRRSRGLTNATSGPTPRDLRT